MFRVGATEKFLINFSRTNIFTSIYSVNNNVQRDKNNSKGIITIRGKGRFEFKEIAGNTRKGRFVIKIDKYV